MRHPADQSLPHYCDPWMFARNWSIVSGVLALENTKELKQWQKDDDAVTVYLEGYTDAEHRSHLKGEIELSLTLQCQRCLESMRWRDKLFFDYIILRSETQENQIDDGSETLICAKDEMDLAWFFEEEVLLAMPMIAKHEQCESPLGNTLPPQQIVEEKENPFAQLKTLMNNKEQP